MIFRKIHFPLLILSLLISCSDKQVSPKEDHLANKYIDSASFFQNNQEYQKAFFYLKKANDVSQNDDNKVYSLIVMANIETKFCDFIEAEDLLTKALDLNKNEKFYPYIYNSLGVAFLEQNDFESSIASYKESLKHVKNPKDSLMIVNNIGVVYLEKKEYKKAIQTLKPLCLSNTFNQDTIIKAKILDNLGYAYFKTKNPNAYSHLKKSYDLRFLLNDDFEKIASNIHLSEYHMDSNRSLAHDFAKQAYLSSKAVNSPDDKLEALKFMIESCDPNMTKSLALEQIKISDSINLVRQKARKEFAKTKYDFKKANENQIRYRKNMIYAIAIAFFILVISIAITYIVRKRNKMKLQNSVYETEKRISKKIHDELANDIFQTMSYAETHDLKTSDSKKLLVDKLDGIYSKTRDISKANSQIVTGKNYTDALFELINSFNSQQTNIIIKNDENINWLNIKDEIKITLYRVLQELLVNMKKHSQASIVVIEFINNNKTISINYYDNGMGVNFGSFTKKGLQNAENRINAVKGAINFDLKIEKGFKVNIQLPK